MQLEKLMQVKLKAIGRSGHATLCAWHMGRTLYDHCMIVFMIHLYSFDVSPQARLEPYKYPVSEKWFFFPQGPNRIIVMFGLAIHLVDGCEFDGLPPPWLFPELDSDMGKLIDTIGINDPCSIFPVWTQYPSRPDDPPVAGCEARVAEHGRRKVRRAGRGSGGWKTQ